MGAKQPVSEGGHATYTHASARADGTASTGPAGGPSPDREVTWTVHRAMECGGRSTSRCRPQPPTTDTPFALRRPVRASSTASGDHGGPSGSDRSADV